MTVPHVCFYASIRFCIIFFKFCAHFTSPGSRSGLSMRIRIQLTKINKDLCESGSKTLYFWCKSKIFKKKYRYLHIAYLDSDAPLYSV